jgi:hypothetical protein
VPRIVGNESDDVKTVQRKAHEENGEGRQNETASAGTDDMELDSTSKVDTSVDSMDDPGPPVWPVTVH